MITKRLLIWAVFISLLGVSLASFTGFLLSQAGIIGAFGLIVFVIGFTLYIIFVLIRFFKVIIPEEVDKMVKIFKNRAK